MSANIHSQAVNNAAITTADPFQGFLDVPLDIIVDLGTTKIKISDLLTIEPGSVIGLSQMIGADLTVSVNNVRIGRGAVVALEDRTCVRITELLAE